MPASRLATSITVSAPEQIFRNAVTWATREANVRRVVLVGSRALTPPPDDLADIDLQVYVRTHEPYTHDLNWLSAIGPVSVCVRDEYSDGGVQVPTRLVIFEGGVKIDFAFYPAGIVPDGIRAGLAHRLLLDKDPADDSREAEAVSSKRLEPPGEAEFRRVVEEFWFEMYYVAKYLARNELWLAKSRDWATKQFLMSMIDWHEQIVRGRRVHDPDWAGKRRYVSGDTWEALHQAFAGFSGEESWAAALATIDLFRRLAKEVAATAGFTYPADVDRNIGGFVLGLYAAGRSDASGGPRP
jgi:aminoglycoside 6-adenylyltransferase